MSHLALPNAQAFVSPESGERADRSWLVRWSLLVGLLWFVGPGPAGLRLHPVEPLEE